MTRSHRLFELMQALRRHRGTVAGAVLAHETGVSLRTLRRDIATLQTMGADIAGEAGVGYVLKPGFTLPPLKFTEEEIHALVAGAQWVGRHTDDGLARAVQNALAKIDAVLTPEMRRNLDDNGLFISRDPDHASEDLGRLRRAVREQRKTRISYRGDREAAAPAANPAYTIWPVMLGFVESRWSVGAWCEELDAFRIFHLDGIASLDFLDERYPGHRRQLVKQWRAQDDHPCRLHDCS